jgi:hypothetical protein
LKAENGLIVELMKKTGEKHEFYELFDNFLEHIKKIEA